MYDYNEKLPEAERYLNKQPPPPSERNAVYREELKHDPTFAKDADVNISDPLAIQDINAKRLHHCHKTSVAAMELKMKGGFADTWVLNRLDNITLEFEK